MKEEICYLKEVIGDLEESVEEADTLRIAYSLQRLQGSIDFMLPFVYGRPEEE